MYTGCIPGSKSRLRVVNLSMYNLDTVSRQVVGKT